MAAFKIPFIESKSLTKGYFDGIPSFRWCDVVDKDEIGKGSFGSVLKATYVPDKRFAIAALQYTTVQYFTAELL